MTVYAGAITPLLEDSKTNQVSDDATTGGDLTNGGIVLLREDQLMDTTRSQRKPAW